MYKRGPVHAVFTSFEPKSRYGDRLVPFHPKPSTSCPFPYERPSSSRLRLFLSNIFLLQSLTSNAIQSSLAVHGDWIYQAESFTLLHGVVEGICLFSRLSCKVLQLISLYSVIQRDPATITHISILSHHTRHFIKHNTLFQNAFLSHHLLSVSWCHLQRCSPTSEWKLYHGCQ